MSHRDQQQAWGQDTGTSFTFSQHSSDNKITGHQWEHFKYTLIRVLSSVINYCNY